MQRRTYALVSVRCESMIIQTAVYESVRGGFLEWLHVKPWNHERNLIGEHLISWVAVVSWFVHVGHVQAMCT